MSVLYVVLPLALVIAFFAVLGFVWMVRGGQLDDLDSPPLRILHDDVEARGSGGESPKEPSASDASPLAPDAKRQASSSS